VAFPLVREPSKSQKMCLLIVYQMMIEAASQLNRATFSNLKWTDKVDQTAELSH